MENRAVFLSAGQQAPPPKLCSKRSSKRRRVLLRSGAKGYALCRRDQGTGRKGVFFFEGHDRYNRVTGVNEWKVSTEFRVYSEPRVPWGVGVREKKGLTEQISWSKMILSKSKYHGVQYMVRLCTGNSWGLLTTKC